MGNVHTKTLGAYLKNVRTSRKMSRKDVIMLRNNEVICSENHLADIENGKCSPSSEILNMLLIKLGISYDGIMEIVYGVSFTAFMNKFAQAWDMVYVDGFEKHIMIIEELKNNKDFDQSIPTIKQAILLLEGCVEMQYRKNYTRSIELHKEALELTVKKSFKNNLVQLSRIENHFFSLIEYRLLKCLAISYASLFMRDEAIDLFYVIQDSLENSHSPYSLKKLLLPSIYFNLSILLYKVNRIADSYSVATQGIEFCNMSREYKELPKLLSHQGLTLHYLHRQDEALASFKSAHSFYIAHNNLERAKYLSERMFNLGKYIPD